MDEHEKFLVFISELQLLCIACMSGNFVAFCLNIAEDLFQVLARRCSGPKVEAL
jgi:hypothetical protein